MLKPLLANNPAVLLNTPALFSTNTENIPFIRLLLLYQIKTVNLTNHHGCMVACKEFINSLFHLVIMFKMEIIQSVSLCDFLKIRTAVQ